MASYRIGIDVGGTFTHAVALEAQGLQLMAQVKVPTTHRAARGVAEGVVQALRTLLSDSGLAPRDVSFIAYSTTQVTNALLEGDVAPVGILAVGAGAEGRWAAGQTRVGELSLAPGKMLRTFHRYLPLPEFSEASVDRALEELTEAGAASVVAAEAFSVDDPRREQLILSRARAAGIPATGTHEVTGRYGLRMRTRTAVINAGLLPKAIATGDLTEAAANEIGITAPLMVVRSDGGVMTVAEMRRRPLLTLLSGPAAGVAAALMYARVSEGVFLEVGGTSTDISAIRHGRALLRTAQVGGHPLFMRTLDVRTLGVAGGSLPRLKDNTIHAVGPRSAHLAGLPYACFSEPEAVAAADRVVMSAPLPGDPADYAMIEGPNGRRFAPTVTCAANALGRIPKGDWAYGNIAAAQAAFAALGGALHLSSSEAAEAMLQVAAQAPCEVVETLIMERGMSRRGTELVAGGGGASALVPVVGGKLDLPVRLSPNASVVSAIGTALAFVREVIERTVPNATDTEVLQLRREAAEAVIRQGAEPSSVSVDVEYDARSAVLRATASGQLELRERDLTAARASDEERVRAAAKSLGVEPNAAIMTAEAGPLHAYRGEWSKKRFFGLAAARGHGIAVVDDYGVTRLVALGGSASAFPAAHIGQELPAAIEAWTRYGDAGAELPQLFLGVRGHIANLSGLSSPAQMLALAQAETSGLTPDESVLVVTTARDT